VPGCTRQAKAVFTIAGSPELTNVYVCLRHWSPFKSVPGVWLSYVEVDLDDDDRADGVVRFRNPRSHWRANDEQEASMQARRRRAVADEPHPIYGSSLLSERLILFDYSNGDLTGAGDEIVNAADALYLHLQEWLAGRLSQPLTPAERAHYEAQAWWLRGIFVGNRKRGKAEGKRHELGLCPQPLTVCVGSVVVGSDPELGTFSAQDPGCGKVIPDTPHAHGGGTMHLSWCDDCPPSRNPRRRKKLLEARRVALLVLTN
jgi:hypothetical protein